MAGRRPTEEQYPLVFWAKKTNSFKPSAKKNLNVAYHPRFTVLIPSVHVPHVAYTFLRTSKLSKSNPFLTPHLYTIVSFTRDDNDTLPTSLRVAVRISKTSEAIEPSSCPRSLVVSS